ncbi:MAG: phosphatidylserine decarboxylase [Alphaproteobacteria bacterium]|nr:phosphatidylserine decarboxylase [Alphaproteobacteria bacterium]
MSRVDLSWRRFILPPIHPEGWRFVGVFAAVTVLMWMLFKPVGVVCLALTVWCYFFFRDPRRAVPAGDTLVLSPADGIVSAIAEVVPPKELEIGEEPMTRISIFMSVFSVHVNRAPMTGKITKMFYRPGAFVDVSLDKESENNERQELAMETVTGQKIAFVQIAGLVARRILTFVKEGDQLKAGERFGLIRFGSRLDVYLPKGVAPLVLEGQTAVAGETILADMAVSGPARKGEIV